MSVRVPLPVCSPHETKKVRALTHTHDSGNFQNEKTSEEHYRDLRAANYNRDISPPGCCGERPRESLVCESIDDRRSDAVQPRNDSSKNIGPLRGSPIACTLQMARVLFCSRKNCIERHTWNLRKNLHYRTMVRCGG